MGKQDTVMQSKVKQGIWMQSMAPEKWAKCRKESRYDGVKSIETER